MFPAASGGEAGQWCHDGKGNGHHLAAVTERELQVINDIQTQRSAADGKAAYISAPDDIKSSRAVVMTFVQRFWSELGEVAMPLREEVDVILAALRNCPSTDSRKRCFRAVPEPDVLSADKGFMLQAMQVDPHLIEVASAALMKDREFILSAASLAGLTTLHHAEVFRGDRDVVLAAVQQNGQALMWATEELKDDLHIALAAVQNNADAVNEVSQRLRGVKDVMLLAVQQKGELLRLASDDLKEDLEVVQAALAQGGKALEHVGGAVKADRELVKSAIRDCGRVFEHASEGLRSDKELLLLALSDKNSYGWPFRFASAALRDDPEALLAALSHQAQLLRFVETRSWRCLPLRLMV
ncbi:hypothetical protein CYMTET_54409 [Cymbomonas tetramitiformis]|uniref:DUF4116 domain-containing protein n=1 Tax=Cymbomonas tetramitiformis TaxID=36881 RepID=A0AAE0BEZ4_9CHLO|nr:hypothetical protein CYMTET_54409 [Cymbomonas tetramitiformis]